jgi:hypothetical protein
MVRYLMKGNTRLFRAVATTSNKPLPPAERFPSGSTSCRMPYSGKHVVVLTHLALTCQDGLFRMAIPAEHTTPKYFRQQLALPWIQVLSAAQDRLHAGQRRASVLFHESGEHRDRRGVYVLVLRLEVPDPLQIFWQPVVRHVVRREHENSLSGIVFPYFPSV